MTDLRDRIAAVLIACSLLWFGLPLWIQMPDWVNRLLHRSRGHAIRYLGNWSDQNVYQCSCGEFFDAWSPTT